VEEVLDYVVWEIRRSGYEGKLIGGLVLTGGGALMNHIDKLAEFHTGMNTRIGTPVEHLAHGYHEQLQSPVFSTAIGLLMKGIQDVEEGKVRYESIQQPTSAAAKAVEEMEAAELSTESAGGGNGLFNKIFQKTKEWFQTEPDAEF